jgi:hypothetical protein
MRPFALLLVALLLAVPACGKRKKPPPAIPQPAPVVEQPKPNPIPAPKEVPAELKNLVQKDWDAIAREGAAFEKAFQAAQIAKDNNDRAAMDVAIEEANRHYQAASDAWAEIAYWPDNAQDDGRIDEATAEVCRKWLGEKNTTVTGWTKKNKGLKEFSRADSSGK